MEFKNLFTVFILAISLCFVLSLTEEIKTNNEQKTDLKKELNEKDSSLTSTSIGTLLRKARQSRCIRCYDDRYYDNERRGYGNERRSYGEGSAGTGYNSRSYDTRGSSNWYHYPVERYDDRASARYYDDNSRYSDRYGGDRYGGDRYGGDRYGGDRYQDRGDRYYDRYDSRTYDRNDNRYDTRQDSRYGNRDRDYYSGDRNNDIYSRDRYYDRNRYPDSRYPEREPPRYDYRNYRPYDETYRGQSGFDYSGRGYYFANDRPNDLPPPPPSYYQYRPIPPASSTPGQPYLPNDSQPPPRPLQNSSQTGGQGGQLPPQQSIGGGYDSNNNNNNNNNRLRPEDDPKGGYAGNWNNYSNNRDKVGYRDDRDKDLQSSPYGGRRPLGGQYLHDRDTNVVGLNNKNTQTTVGVDSKDPANNEGQISENKDKAS